MHILEIDIVLLATIQSKDLGKSNEISKLWQLNARLFLSRFFNLD